MDSGTQLYVLHRGQARALVSKNRIVPDYQLAKMIFIITLQKLKSTRQFKETCSSNGFADLEGGELDDNSVPTGKRMCNTSRYRYCYLPQDVLRDGLAFLDNLLVEFIQRRVHQLHTDPHVPLRGKKRRKAVNIQEHCELGI